jgi:hypothetical protein
MSNFNIASNLLLESAKTGSPKFWQAAGLFDDDGTCCINSIMACMHKKTQQHSPGRAEVSPARLASVVRNGFRHCLYRLFMRSLLVFLSVNIAALGDQFARVLGPRCWLPFCSILGA